MEKKRVGHRGTLAQESHLAELQEDLVLRFGRSDRERVSHELFITCETHGDLEGGLAVAENEVGADAQRVGADLVAETLPPAVARLDVHQRAVELPDEFDRARGDDAVDGVVEAVGELAQRHQLDGLRVQRGTG